MPTSCSRRRRSRSAPPARRAAPAPDALGSQRRRPGEAARRLGAYLDPPPGAGPRGRRLHAARRATCVPHRRSLVVGSVTERVRWRRSSPTSGGRRTASAATPPDVVFMFPGQGAQYPGMAAGCTRPSPSSSARSTTAAKRSRPTSGSICDGCCFPATHNATAAPTAGHRAGAARAVRRRLCPGPAVAVVGRAADRDDRPQRRRVRRGNSVRRDRARRRAAPPRGARAAHLGAARRLDARGHGAGRRGRRLRRRRRVPRRGERAGPVRPVRTDAAIDAGGEALVGAVHRGPPTPHVARVSLVDDGSDPRRVRGFVDRIPLSPPTIPYVSTLTGHGPALTSPSLTTGARRSDRPSGSPTAAGPVRPKGHWRGPAFCSKSAPGGR